ncbi:hypothetical protein A3C87_02670 [Candidatus Kaiserbacteria bacterium RIFCSPHIGHO2_02_FULL_49_34]|uniref:superoxide dismutase n=1 Tax=Candidatus Kaiserbacteria bacterium RIFCSPHIGHO2_02_FULL_49_34 TaxID=1798491 RepID=A0A1F6DJP2_9BACT|nr:MAG: hypothetical protein A3C87_02670 [Candidatus Kaiserbacteria bacterium RIFCSPHIGHO2_02_FULL_49_34]
MTYSSKIFTLPTLTGISEEQVAVHLKLYEGYVTHTNKIATILAASRDGSAPLDAYVEAELRRRFAFEFCGMRLHEYYFEQFEHGATPLADSSRAAQLATAKYDSVDGFIAHIKAVAATRGIGWVVVTHDPVLDTLHTTFVADHELGNLAGLDIILALDLWEHAYMVDRVPAQKMEYVDAFFANLNWDVVAKRLA